MDKSIQETYGNRLRVRVSGLCFTDDKILLVNHRGLYKHDFWAPPGGGVEFGQTAEMSLVREFKEETGLEVGVEEFHFACEFIQPPLHAIELFFAVTQRGGVLARGRDPELDEKEQIINDVKYFSETEINSIPERHKHGFFKLLKNGVKIRDIRGYWKI